MATIGAILPTIVAVIDRPHKNTNLSTAIVVMRGVVQHWREREAHFCLRPVECALDLLALF